MKRKYTNEQEYDICRKYLSGLTMEQVGSMVGSCFGVISHILKRNNIKTRLSKKSGKVGIYCSRFKGGRWFNKKGYICISVPNYKWAHKGDWIQEHRYVMQNYLGRKLKPSEHIHHINGIKTDNRIENLQVIKAGEHSHIHNPKGMKCRNPYGRGGKKERK